MKSCVYIHVLVASWKTYFQHLSCHRCWQSDHSVFSLLSLQVWKMLMRMSWRRLPHLQRKLTSTTWQTSAWWATSWKVSPRPFVTAWSSSTGRSKVWRAAGISRVRDDTATMLLIVCIAVALLMLLVIKITRPLPHQIYCSLVIFVMKCPQLCATNTDVASDSRQRCCSLLLSESLCTHNRIISALAGWSGPSFTRNRRKISAFFVICRGGGACPATSRRGCTSWPRDLRDNCS